MISRDAQNVRPRVERLLSLKVASLHGATIVCVSLEHATAVRSKLAQEYDLVVARDPFFKLFMVGSAMQELLRTLPVVMAPDGKVFLAPLDEAAVVGLLRPENVTRDPFLVLCVRSAQPMQRAQVVDRIANLLRGRPVTVSPGASDELVLVRAADERIALAAWKLLQMDSSLIVEDMDSLAALFVPKEPEDKEAADRRLSKTEHPQVVAMREHVEAVRAQVHAALEESKTVSLLHRVSWSDSLLCNGECSFAWLHLLCSQKWIRRPQGGRDGRQKCDWWI